MINNDRGQSLISKYEWIHKTNCEYLLTFANISLSAQRFTATQG